ncbi:MAG: hypothetical protein JXA74_08025, partial [Anaerolineae bacterium]|nr:hypothetical protein [Anaerolineae bacterium]
MGSAARPGAAPGRSFLYVAPSYVPFVGGAQRFQQAMASRLAADGCAVAVLTSAAREPADFWRPPRPDQPHAAGPEDRFADLDGVRVARLPLAYPWPAPWMFGLLRRAG